MLGFEILVLLASVVVADQSADKCTGGRAEQEFEVGLVEWLPIGKLVSISQVQTPKNNSNGQAPGCNSTNRLGARSVLTNGGQLINYPGWTMRAAVF